jgi:hypothetical protein
LLPAACLQASLSAEGRPDSILVGYFLSCLEHMSANQPGCVTHSLLRVIAGGALQSLLAALGGSHPRDFVYWSCCRIFFRLIANGLLGEAAVLLHRLQQEQRTAARCQPATEDQKVLHCSRRMVGLLLTTGQAVEAVHMQAAAVIEFSSAAAAQQAQQLVPAAEELAVFGQAALALMELVVEKLPGQVDCWSAKQCVPLLGDLRLSEMLQTAAAAALRVRQQVCAAWEAVWGVLQPQAAQAQASGRFGDLLAAPPAEQLLLRAAEAQATRACANLACTNASGASEASQKRGRRCAGCTLLRYCFAACQQADWQGHRATSRLLVRRKAAGL